MENIVPTRPVGLSNRSAATARKLRRLALALEAGGDVHDLALAIIVCVAVELVSPRWRAPAPAGGAAAP